MRIGFKFAGMSGDERDYELLNRLADRVPSMLAYWDRDLRCRYANRAYEQWFARTPESMIGIHIRDLLGPALFELNRPYMERALAGERQQFERDVPDPRGGEPRHSLAEYLPDRDDTGAIRGFMVVVTDVSEVKRTQKQLAESEARFATMFELSSDAIIGADVDQRISLFNKGAERIFGYARDEVMGKPIDILIPERLHEVHRAHVAAFLKAPERTRRWHERNVDIFALRKGGIEFPGEASISKIDLGDGKPMITVALRDITERRLLEAEQTVLAEAGIALASSLEYRQTLRSVAQLVVKHVSEICVIDMYEQADASLMRLTVAHRDPDMAEVCEQLAGLPLDSRHVLATTALETGTPQLFDDITPAVVHSITQEPEHVRLLARLSPRSAIVVPLTASDRVFGALVFASTLPHRFGERDMRLATELGRRASIAIENATLYEAARRATEARDQVLGIVAHDVRSPLNAIQLAARTLERRPGLADDPRGRQAVEMVMASVQRANRLITDLLDVSRIEGGVLEVEHCAVEVAPVIADALRTHELAAAEAGVELRAELPDGLPPIAGDHHRLVQVLENLVGNALKFTPAGGSITIRGCLDEDQVSISIADTGVGMPPEHVGKIFDRFWQADRKRRDGAGLGLTICKGIVEAHGGRIWAESVRGLGTTFHFTLPIAARERRSAPAMESASQ